MFPICPALAARASPNGRTSAPEGYSRFLMGFTNALGIGRAALVGHSLGGGVALRAVLDHPGLVERLILVNSAGLGSDVSLPLRVASLPFFERVFFKPPLWVFKRFLRRLVYDPAVITPEFARMYYEIFFQPKAIHAFAEILRAICTLRGARPGILEPIREGLGTIRTPTLVIWGRQDRILPSSQAFDAVARIPGARLRVFEHCGHMPNVEYPEEFNRIVLEFLNESER